MGKIPLLKIVPIHEIPIAEETPTDNLLAVFRVITQMEKICIDNKGIGLSAVQIGIPWKLFIIQRNAEFEYYLNCEYIGQGEKGKSIEGCLSIKSEQGKIRQFELERFSAILVKGKRLKASDSPSLVLEDISEVEQGLMAVVFQHEIDHQRQILICDIGKEIQLL